MKVEISAGKSDSGSVQSKFKVIGEIFSPVIPGIIAAGICAGFAALLTQIVPDYRERTFFNLLYQLLSIINVSFMTYMTAWTGYCACQRFGGTAILGGMLGMITCLGSIDDLAMTLGLYSTEDPLNSVLCANRGGILAAIIGAWLIAKVERHIHAKMPEVLDTVCTPLFSLLTVTVPYVLLIMPGTGVISTLLCSVLASVCMSDKLWIRLLTGYVCAALFLPMVLMGMQFAFVTLYSMQYESMGFVTLFPALAMAGAAQVGTGMALLLMARRVGNRRFAGIISGSILPGMMGIGNPLLYGVTVPLGTPFLTSCIAGGFGGAFIMAVQVASTSWGPSGVIAIPLMTAGPNGPFVTMLLYAAGLAISCAAGFLITAAAIKPEKLEDKPSC